MTTACGSLREEMRPGDFVLVDQFIDLTRKRDSTFFEDHDCWRVGTKPVAFAIVKKRMVGNARKVKKLIMSVIRGL